MASRDHGEEFRLTDSLLRDLIEARESPEKIIQLLGLSSREIRRVLAGHRFHNAEQECLTQLLASAEQLEVGVVQEQDLSSKIAAVFQETLEAFEGGVGSGLAIHPEVVQILQARYMPWFVTRKQGVPGTPLEIWPEQRQNFLINFHRIGRRSAARAHGSTIRASDVYNSLREVESSADCPYCPAA